jgi:hypothetical protein
LPPFGGRKTRRSSVVWAIRLYIMQCAPVCGNKFLILLWQNSDHFTIAKRYPVTDFDKKAYITLQKRAQRSVGVALLDIF